MITHKCDVCNQDIAERFVVVIDNKEHDLCKACKAKTVGKVKNGRAVVKQIEYVPWYVQPAPWHWDYYKPTWIGTPNTDTPYPEPAKIWCGNDTVTELTTTPAPNSGCVYLQGNEQKSFTSGYVEILN